MSRLKDFFTRLKNRIRRKLKSVTRLTPMCEISPEQIERTEDETKRRILETMIEQHGGNKEDWTIRKCSVIVEQECKCGKSVGEDSVQCDECVENYESYLQSLPFVEGDF